MASSRAKSLRFAAYLCLHLLLFKLNLVDGSDQKENEAVILKLESYIVENDCVFPSAPLMRPIQEARHLREVCNGSIQEAKTDAKVKACLELYNLTVEICNDKLKLNVSASNIEKMMNTSFLCTQFLETVRGLEDQTTSVLQRLDLREQSKCLKFCDPKEVGSLCALLFLSDSQIQLHKAGFQMEGFPTLSPSISEHLNDDASGIKPVLAKSSNSEKTNDKQVISESKPPVAIKSEILDVKEMSTTTGQQGVSSKLIEEQVQSRIKVTSQLFSTDGKSLLGNNPATKFIPTIQNLSSTKGSNKMSTNGIDEQHPNDQQIQEPGSDTKDELSEKKSATPKKDNNQNKQKENEAPETEDPKYEDGIDDVISNKGKGSTNVIEDKIYSGYYNSGEDGHFFIFFLAGVALCVVLYLVFHNKQKIIALIIEGRQDRRYRLRGRYRILSTGDVEDATAKWKGKDSAIY